MFISDRDKNERKSKWIIFLEFKFSYFVLIFELVNTQGYIVDNKSTEIY